MLGLLSQHLYSQNRCPSPFHFITIYHLPQLQNRRTVPATKHWRTSTHLPPSRPDINFFLWFNHLGFERNDKILPKDFTNLLKRLNGRIAFTRILQFLIGLIGVAKLLRSYKLQCGLIFSSRTSSGAGARRFLRWDDARMLPGIY
jgi:hypothetical protein